MKQVFDEILSKYEEIPEDGDSLYMKMVRQEVNFESNIKEIVISPKERRVMCVEKQSLEEITLLYLKKRMDEVFQVTYPDRSRIIRELFSFLTVISGISDFVIFRYDFKDFFQSVSSEGVFERKLKFSGLHRFEKDLLEEMIRSYNKCYPGLATSNALIEIASKDFDIQVKSKLGNMGLIYYARYVDDGIIIFNRQIEKEKLINIIKESISEVFQMSKVKLNYDKVKYISKKEITSEDFSYLGYRYILEYNNNKLEFKYGISSEKIEKYRRKFLSIIKAYTASNNDELFKQRLQYMFSRVVFYNKFESKYSHKTQWDVIGIISNYCELRNYINIGNKIIDETKTFLTDEFIVMLDQELGSMKRPYFLRGKYCDSYTLIHRMMVNRSIVFHPHLGWSQGYLKGQIRKINPTIEISKKPYRELVKMYCSLLKIQKESEITP